MTEHDHRRQRDRFADDVAVHEVRDIERIADEVSEEIILQESHAELLLCHRFFRLIDFLVRLGEALLEHTRDLRIETDLLGVILQVEHALDVFALSLRRVAAHAHLVRELVIHLIEDVAQDEGGQHEQDRELVLDEEVAAGQNNDRKSR